MSLHIEMIPEAEAEMKRACRRDRLASVAVSLTSCFLGGLALYLTVKLFESPESATFQPYVPVQEALPPTPQPRVKEVHAQLSGASPNIAPDIAVAFTAGPVSLPVVDVPNDSEMFGQGISLGAGFGSGTLGDGIGTGTGGLGTENAGGSTLEGSFYDLKQTAAGAPTGMNPGNCKKILQEFVTTGWNKSMLSKYFMAPTKLYTSCFYMPVSKAAEAPYAYKVEDKVQPSMWAAVYRGRVVAPKTGKFRFVGYGDDALVVRFNGKNVFDYGWEHITSGRMMGGQPGNRAELKDDKGEPRKFYKYTKAGHDWNEGAGGMCSGDVFSVEAGKSYPIEVMISEIPGGKFGFVLLIEDVDSPPAQKDGTGSPIFQLFRTNFAEPNVDELYKNMKEPLPGERSEVPYDKDSLIWQSI